MKKFITLLTIFIAFISLNAFTIIRSNEKVKDGTYKAIFTYQNDTPVGASHKFEVDVIVKNNLIYFISPNRYNFTYEHLLNKNLIKDDEGNYYVSASVVEQNMNNKNDKSRIAQYKIIINRKQFSER